MLKLFSFTFLESTLLCKSSSNFLVTVLTILEYTKDLTVTVGWCTPR